MKQQYAVLKNIVYYVWETTLPWMLLELTIKPGTTIVDYFDTEAEAIDFCMEKNKEL